MHYGRCENGEWIKISVQLRMCPTVIGGWKWKGDSCCFYTGSWHDKLSTNGEDLQKSLDKTFNPPLQRQRAARWGRWSLQSTGRECNSALSTFICMHNSWRDKNITWSELGKKQNIQAEKVFVLTPIKVFFLICSSLVLLTGSLGRPSAFHWRISKGSARTLMRLNSSDTGIPSSLQRCIHDEISSLRYRLVNAPKYATQAAATKTFPTTLPISSSNAWKKWE